MREPKVDSAGKWNSAPTWRRPSNSGNENAVESRMGIDCPALASEEQPGCPPWQCEACCSDDSGPPISSRDPTTGRGKCPTYRALGSIARSNTTSAPAFKRYFRFRTTAGISVSMLAVSHLIYERRGMGC